jgi:hypothetical protein
MMVVVIVAAPAFAGRAIITAAFHCDLLEAASRPLRSPIRRRRRCRPRTRSRGWC